MMNSNDHEQALQDAVLELCTEYERDEYCDTVYIARQIERLHVAMRGIMGEAAFDAAIRNRMADPTPERLALKADRDAVISTPEALRDRLRKEVLPYGTPRPPGGTYMWRFADGVPVDEGALLALEDEGVLCVAKGMLDGHIDIRERVSA